jgi:hypothetical protein
VVEYIIDHVPDTAIQIIAEFTIGCKSRDVDLPASSANAHGHEVRTHGVEQGLSGSFGRLLRMTRG